MTWTIKYLASLEKPLREIIPADRVRICSFLEEKLVRRDPIQYRLIARQGGRSETDFTTTSGTVNNGNTVTFSITDGGLGDDDLEANGIIVDQGGPGVPVDLSVPSGAAFIPALSKWALLIVADLMGLFGGAQVRPRKTSGLKYEFVRGYTPLQRFCGKISMR